MLETKGMHLKDNPDTKYKEKLFEVLEKTCNAKLEVGELTGVSEPSVSYKILLEEQWEEDPQQRVCQPGAAP